MILGLRLHDAEKLPLEAVLPIVKLRGFDCVHLALSKCVPDYSDDCLTPEFAAYLRKIFDENSLKIAVLGCYFDLSADYDRYERHLRFAANLRPVVVGTETNCRDRSKFFQNLAKCVELAQSLGVCFAIEPVASHLINSPRRALELVKDFPGLRIILDPVNLLSLNTIGDAESLVGEALGLLEEYTDIVHIKDFVPEKEGIIAVAAGQGRFNYTEIAAFLRRKPGIYVTLENTNPENMEAAREFLIRRVDGGL